MNINRKKILSLLLISIFYFFSNFATPKLTVVMVIDQFAYDYITKLNNNFNYAFKKLLKKGMNYTNANHPHGIPTTATGHTALNTGTFAKNHGIILNGWKSKNNKKLKYNIDNNPRSAVLKMFGKQKYGISAKNIMAEGLSDQFAKANKNYKVFALSHKARAAIGMGGKNGHPIWFDDKQGIFTSSKAFFNRMPNWVRSFNKKNKIKDIAQNKQWKLLYPSNSKYYQLENIDFHKKTNYKYSQFKESLILNDAIYTTTQYINKKPNKLNYELYDGFLKSPFANQILLDLAKSCINNTLNKKGDKMLLWISLSPLDKLGHVYGPQSIEVTDLIYHLDKQINNFIKYIQNKVGKQNILFVLTADHGISPLPEVMQKKGVNAHRIQANNLIHKINNFIKNKYKISNLVTKFKTAHFYIDKNKFNNLSKKKTDKILQDIKKIIKKEPGVKKVWTYEELKNKNYKFDSIENFYKQQLYPKRSGDLICMTNRFSFFTTYPFGTAHRSGYYQNTHVPLIIYQKNKYENKTFTQKVWIPQLPVTLAYILNVSKPPASEFSILPGF